jgi:hypothetical protein
MHTLLLVKGQTHINDITRNIENQMDNKIIVNNCSMFLTVLSKPIMVLEKDEGANSVVTHAHTAMYYFAYITS